MKHTTNRDSHLCTSKKEPFKAHNLFGEYNYNSIYVVYSYGYHFPLYAFKNGLWYENIDKYSVSTSKQKTQSRPNTTEFLKVSTEEIQQLIKY